MVLHHVWDRTRFLPAREKTPSMYANYLKSQPGKPHMLVLVAEVSGSPVGYGYAEMDGSDYMPLRGRLE